VLFQRGNYLPPLISPQSPCRKLFTILPTLIVNNNNNKRRRSSCAKFQNNPIQAATNKKKTEKIQGKAAASGGKPREKKSWKTLYFDDRPSLLLSTLSPWLPFKWLA